MSWYNSLVGFGFHDNEDIDPKDDDVKIIPSVIEKAVLPKLIGKQTAI
jgi:cold shock CspA family protein